MRTIAEVHAEILACVKRGDHMIECGYPYENQLNDLQRELIAACAREWGECWLGKINLYEQDRGNPVIWKWQGDTVLNFAARFVIPQFDAELERLILERDQAPYTGTLEDIKRVLAIFKRLDEIGGRALIWN